MQPASQIFADIEFAQFRICSVRVADDLDMHAADDAPSDYDSEDSNGKSRPAVHSWQRGLLSERAYHRLPTAMPLCGGFNCGFIVGL
jgi:hypothetical protein